MMKSLQLLSDITPDDVITDQPEYVGLVENQGSLPNTNVIGNSIPSNQQLLGVIVVIIGLIIAQSQFRKPYIDPVILLIIIKFLLFILNLIHLLYNDFLM